MSMIQCTIHGYQAARALAPCAYQNFLDKKKFQGREVWLSWGEVDFSFYAAKDELPLPKGKMINDKCVMKDEEGFNEALDFLRSACAKCLENFIE